MSLLEFLKDQKILLLDGAMGTQLDKRGLIPCGRNNINSPEAVLEIHREYCQAGCNAITTNTLTMNRIYIETHNVGTDVKEVNKAGAELARGLTNYTADDVRRIRGLKSDRIAQVLGHCPYAEVVHRDNLLVSG